MKRRRSVLKQVKGYKFGRSKKERQAHEAIFHAGAHALAHRRDKKNDFRRVWQVKIGAAVRPLGLSYSAFIGALKKSNIALDRKSLAALAKDYPETFARLLQNISK